MSDRAVLFLVSVAVVLVCLGTSGWLVATGQAAYLDGLFLLATCLVLALAFGVYVVVLIRRAMEELKASPAPETRTPTPASAARPAAPERERSAVS
jgi:hypothetical protein